LKATAYDALDRTMSQYSYSPTTTSAVSCGDALERATLAYDSSVGTYGLLASKTDPLNEKATYSYDNDGHLYNTVYSNDGGVTPAETKTYDADGRVVGIESATLGLQQYTYDQDDRLQRIIEPPNLPSAATISYTYYPNGWRSGITAVAGALAQTPSWLYSYRNDGLPTQEALSYGSTSLQITHGYTATGRPLTMSDGNATRQLSYNAYGKLNTDSGGPLGPYSNFTYDDEGEPLSYSATYNASNVNVTQQFTIRGELQKQAFSNWVGPSQCGAPLQSGLEWQGVQQKIADGFPAPLSWDSSKCVWDSKTGFNVLSGLTGGGNGTGYYYDAAGRQNQATATMSGQYCKADTCDPWTESGSYTKQYDAENHLIGQTFSTWPAYGSLTCPRTWTYSNSPTTMPTQYNLTLSYKWGPTGQVAEMGNDRSGSMQYTAVHWDGQSVLFTSGASQNLWLGQDGNILISTTGAATVLSNINARDFAGAEGTPPSPNRTLCTGGQPFPDGISDGYNIFQGARNYDPAIGTWSTPDAYQGVFGDPMSQHAYMWNRNNSFLYQDPSGYAAITGPIMLMPENVITDIQVARAVWKALVGDDLKTVTNSRASVGARLLAAVSLASWALPEARGAVKGVTFSAKVLSQIAHGADAYHGFGPLVDKAVLTEGRLTVKADGYHMFTLDGAVNGVDGQYEIGGYVKNGTLVIDHHFFNPLDTHAY
jgi:YD repeat-containing protein